MLKMALFTPIASASVTTVITAKAGPCASVRTA